jgi:hypothetical protein
MVLHGEKCRARGRKVLQLRVHCCHPAGSWIAATWQLLRLGKRALAGEGAGAGAGAEAQLQPRGAPDPLISQIMNAELLCECDLCMKARERGETGHVPAIACIWNV